MTSLLLLWFFQDAVTSPGREFEQDRLRQLLELKRVHVERLSGENSAQIRDMLMTAIQESKLWIVTENPEKADAILRGSAEDLIYTDTFQSSESLGARGAASVSEGVLGRSRNSRAGSSNASESESTRISERRHEASTALRLINKDGDVLWSTTQESRGAKFRGAAADVADKVVKKLAEDYDRARKLMKK